MLIENLEADSLCAQHLIDDVIKVTSKEVHEIESGTNYYYLVNQLL